jgi:hypothetical protein
MNVGPVKVLCLPPLLRQVAAAKRVAGRRHIRSHGRDVPRLYAACGGSDSRADSYGLLTVLIYPAACGIVNAFGG